MTEVDRNRKLTTTVYNMWYTQSHLNLSWKINQRQWCAHACPGWGVDVHVCNWTI